MENVHTLPGIPRLFQTLITDYLTNVIWPELISIGQLANYRRILGTNLMEGDIAQILCDVQAKLTGRVAIGSYPRDETYSYRVAISLEGSQEDVKRGIQWIQNAGLEFSDVTEHEEKLRSAKKK
jgi:molybdopterin-biosynthesis enzyme MoeA-like protein